MNVTVIGTGYLGAVHAAGMAALGHNVLGVDADPAKIAVLARGEAPFFEPGLPELLRQTVSSGSLSFTTSLQEAAEFGDVHFVCVGTPQLEGSHSADVSFVDAVVTELASYVTRSCLIVGKSTVPVGTARRLAALARSITAAGVPVMLAWNPEFLREGFAVEDTLNPDRLVFGVSDDRSEQILRSVYAPILDKGTAVFCTDLETAELVKVAANSFLATKISFINAMAEVCEVVGADVVTLADAIGQDARIGRQFLNAGVGFGGGCLGKDIRAFRARGEELGVGEALEFLGSVESVNTRRRQRVLDLAANILDGDVAGRRIAILGASFKPNSDDVRDSPALHVARALHSRGAVVTVHDPAAIANARRAAPQLGYAGSITDAVQNADLVVHLTEWEEYQELDPGTLHSLVAAKNIIDARNALEPDDWNAAGWNFHALGRPIAPAWATTSISNLVLSEAEEEEVA
ncbi:UDP-glucose/GDP-mannose dehydrogenase family protein [Cryobacterium glaciale]|uniref:UDP-glucose 6-dehydrogenase n=1 Tax=Cryobacterium glaciale TaxID=1259145 RepID=A0A4R8V2D1_9MICO|nr:UDP-glucose/GDP-mannose dehydrogenase family protein [Cryobacterium glaciale]TFB76409.1 UDP-glucose/GDP-mannose dehydrogenase family protein [Cryobacterium glaciale]